ncbi:MAG: serine/threonine protein kinase [Sandaracinaceae bacterium]|nr:serine/threonine protein kinase [Sandaracinaceae bacterium]
MSPAEAPAHEPARRAVRRRPARRRPEADATIATGELALRRCRTCGEEYPSDYVVCPRDATPLGLDRESEDPLLGVLLAGTYRIARGLGRGGMGRLYEAQHARLDRRFAVKVLHETHARSRDAVRRFEREARALSRIRSEHVLDVVDVIRTPDGRAAIVTARLDGEDLKARLDRVGTLAIGEAIGIARQVCRGLAAAHAEGVIHRDLKPSNLFLECSADGRTVVKILDFGVAKLEGEDEMTRTGAVVGTPAFMAPEQARGSAKVDPRADVYAVGAVLYRMVTGRAPYVGDEPAKLLTSLLHEPPPRPRAIVPDLPVGLEALIQRAMARDPDGRPDSALDLDRELAAFDEGSVGAARWEPPAGEHREVSTLILPRGSVDRAQALAVSARRARPAAAGLTALGALGAGATMALLVVGAQTWTGPARSALAVSTGWLLAGAATVGAAAALSRWLARSWVSAPEVLRYDRTVGAALLAAAASVGAIELYARAAGALEGITGALDGPGLVGRGALALAAALAAGTWAHRTR